MTTPNFELPEWEQNQDQPYVDVNTALRILECLAQLIVQDRDLNEPSSGDVNDGDCFIVSGTGVGDWLGAEDGDVAMVIGNTWLFRTPKIGWEAYVVDEDLRVRFSGASPSSGWEVI